MATITATAPSSVDEARAAGIAMLDRDVRMVAAYFALPFGDVVVTRSGDVYLADEYDAGTVGPACRPSTTQQGGRYPHLPTCTCGWTWGRGYLADHAAQGIADAHARGQL